MRNRILLTSILMACLLAFGSLGVAPVANAASAGQSLSKPDKSARNYVIASKRRGRGPRVGLPIGPSYVYYDYPYYYSRGYYPTHIVGYVYYPYRSDYPRYGSRCFHWHRECVTHRGPGSPLARKARRN